MIIETGLGLKKILTNIPILFLIWGCEARKGSGHLEGFQWWSEDWDCKPGTGHLPVGITFSWEIESLMFHQGNFTLSVLYGIQIIRCRLTLMHVFKLVWLKLNAIEEIHIESYVMHV